MTRREDRPTHFGKNPPRVLVIEDDGGVRALFDRLLRGFGCIVVGARTGAEARAFAADAAWDVVFLDLGLPDVDGLALLPELGLLQRDHGTTFIVLSGRRVSPDEVPEGTTILMKPIRIHDLTTAAKAGIDSARARRTRASTPRARGA